MSTPRPTFAQTLQSPAFAASPVVVLADVEAEPTAPLEVPDAETTVVMVVIPDTVLVADANGSVEPDCGGPVGLAEVSVMISCEEELVLLDTVDIDEVPVVVV